ncbi:hypothetical protein [Deinococcus multiflagellatus]|nr:hypothetical protein [Deinococcus multiflagellatus]MBZ9712154.1 hypothetical protein [Deinococcus multiflagellatus]
MPTPLKPHEVAQLLRLHARGYTVTQLQRLCGRPPHFISAVLAQEGLK